MVTNATVVNGINPVITETQWYRDGASVATGSTYELTAADTVGSVITARQLFTDDRTNTLLSEPSNGITILDRPADAITFTPAITDDGSQLANTPTHVLTADAGTIVGGTAPIEYGFVWKSAGVEVGVTTKTYTIQNSDIGNVISCDVTVAEPDGSNPETRTATYAQTIINGASINEPLILSPGDEAGIADPDLALDTDTLIFTATPYEDTPDGETTPRHCNLGRRHISRLLNRSDDRQQSRGA